MSARRSQVFLAVVAVVLFPACRQQPPPSFDLLLADSSLVIDQGATGVTEITAGCDPGFVGPVKLTLQASPTGVAGTFVPEALSCSGSSTLTLHVDPTVQPGTFEMRVHGVGGEVTAHAQLTLVVTAVSTDFTLSLDPTGLSIEQSLEAIVAVNVIRSAGFPDDVVLSLGDGPTGISGSFQPNPVTGSASSLSLEVGSDAPVGVHPLTVVATAGVVTHTAGLSVTVTERGFRLVGIPSEVSVTAPSSSVLPVIIERTPSFDEAITLTIEGAPAGVGSSFDPNPSSTTGSVLTLSVADAVGAGSYVLTVRAESSQGYVDTMSFTLAVAPPTEEGFNIRVEPTQLTLKQGQQANVAVTIERPAGFDDPVALFAVVDPDAQHITMSFDPPLAAGSSIMTVAIGINVPPRTYQIVVQGLSDRVGANAAISLVVNEDD